MKRVLVISYSFPPASNMGSHRILRFVRHLREFGWEPVVLTAWVNDASQTDASLLERMPRDARIERVSGVDLTGLWRALRGGGPSAGQSPSGRGLALTTFLNRWVMIPDKFFPWIRPAVRAAETMLRAEKFDAIYSTSDPLSDHLVGLRLAQRTGVPWVAEFRDLWLGSPYFARAHPTALHRALHALLERRVVAGATALVALSRGIGCYFEKTYNRKAQVIYNNFEPEDYPYVAPSAGKFTVLYTGAMYSSRSPEPFLAGLAEFVRQQQLTPAQVEFVWLGSSHDLDVRGMAERLEVLPFVRLEGRVAHAEALRRTQSASVLLTIQSPEDNIHVPGKLFEYIGAGRPILAVSQPCEVTELVRSHGVGRVAGPSAPEVAAALNEMWTSWRRGEWRETTRDERMRFGAAARTRELAELLEQASNPVKRATT